MADKSSKIAQPVDGSLVEGKRVLCLASTPFQLMCLLYSLHSVEMSLVRECDLLVYSDFAGANALIEPLQATGLFGSVWCVQPFYPEYHHLGTTYILENAFKKEECRQRFFQSCPFLIGGEYDVLLCSCANRLSLDAKRYCVPKGFSIFFDDGAGSHSGNVFKNFACFDAKLVSMKLSLSSKERLKAVLRRLGCMIVGKDACFDIRQIWLISPSQKEVDSFAGYNVRLIVPNDEDGMVAKTLSKSFDAANYENVKHIYLVSSGFLPEETLEKEHSIIAQLNQKLGGRLFLRLHPNRSSEDFEDFKDQILPREDLWELLIGEGIITGDSCLYGLCTTAQLSPKTIYGIEPTVTFLYHLVSSNGLPITDFNQMASDLKNAYMDSDKVFMPTDEVSFWNYIDRVICTQR